MRLPERSHLKNGVCEGGNWFQAGLPWQTCPLRRVIPRIQLMNRGKFSIGSCQRRCKFAAIRPDVPNISLLSPLRIERDFIFTIVNSARCYPAFVALLGPLTWPQVTRRSF